MKYVFPAAPLISWLPSRCVWLWVEGPARLRRERPVSSPSTTSTEEGAALSVFPFGNCVFVYFVFVRVRRRWVGIRLCGCEDLVGMTVLEEARMSGSLGGDRYITPEYLAPLPQVSTISKKCILLNFQKVISSNCNRYLTMTASCCCSAKYLLWIFVMIFLSGRQNLNCNDICPDSNFQNVWSFHDKCG